MTAVIASVVDVSSAIESFSSNIIGPFATLQIVGPEILAYAI
jgi:hypothetical protein